ncbi:MAG: Rossmann-like and DUF2520 domain-containing protein [Bacteroidaceae bacterium]
MELPKIVLLGSGNLATHVGLALYEAGVEVKQVFSRDLSNATLLASQIAASATNDLSLLYTDADIYLFALKDSVLPEVVSKVASLSLGEGTLGQSAALFLHTAGSVPLALFEGKVLHGGVFYPMQTFSKARAVDFRVIPIFIEATTPEDTEVLETLAFRISTQVTRLSSEQRKYLHLGAVLSCNFVNHLFTLCSEVLAKQDIPFETMWPLIQETIQKVHQLSPQEAQTGPAVRYDRNIIDSQLALLEGDQRVQDIYRLFSESIYAHSNSH